MTLPVPSDFKIGPVHGCWLALPPDSRAQSVAEGWLRDLAGDVVAEGLHRDARQRPRLAQGDISWSHSHGRLLLAYCEHGRLGVDTESRLRRTDPMRIARRYFAQEEHDLLESLNGAARHAAFQRLWCAKEAVLKAHGGGIAFGLDKVVFDLADDGVRMRRCDPALGQVNDWCLHLFEPEPDFIAVLASTP